LAGGRPLQHLNRIDEIRAETKRIIDLYRELDDADAVAERLQIRPSRVKRLMRDANVSVAILRVERAVQVFQETGDLHEAASKLGVCVATTRRRLQGGVVMGLIDDVPEINPAHFRAVQTPGLLPVPARGRRLSPEEEARTIALYNELGSLRKVGELLGITQEAVRCRLKSAGAHRPREWRLARDEQQQVVTLYAELGSVMAVSKRIGRSTLAVRRVLEAAGVAITRGASTAQREWRDNRRQRRIGEATLMQRLYERLGSQTAVADVLGVSQTLVSNRMKLIGTAPGRGSRRPLGPRQPELIEKAILIYLDGASARQAAISTGLRPHTLLTWLRRAGYDTSKPAMLERRRAAA
jgi:predicted transcriptional regulator